MPSRNPIHLSSCPGGRVPTIDTLPFLTQHMILLVGSVSSWKVAIDLDVPPDLTKDSRPIANLVLRPASPRECAVPELDEPHGEPVQAGDGAEHRRHPHDGQERGALLYVEGEACAEAVQRAPPVGDDDGGGDGEHQEGVGSQHGEGEAEYHHKSGSGEQNAEHCQRSHQPASSWSEDPGGGGEETYENQAL